MKLAVHKDNDALYLRLDDTPIIESDGQKLRQFAFDKTKEYLDNRYSTGRSEVFKIPFSSSEGISTIKKCRFHVTSYPAKCYGLNMTRRSFLLLVCLRVI